MMTMRVLRMDRLCAFRHPGQNAPRNIPRYLYRSCGVCYKPGIEKTTPLRPTSSEHQITPGTCAHFPIAACSEQDRRFGADFEILRQAICEKVFPAASVAVIFKGQLVALKGLGRFTYEAES